MFSFLGRWLPVSVWMLMIFLGSSDLLAANHTSRFIEPLLHWMFAGISQPMVDEIHFLIRKMGHVCEYAVLALLFLRALWSLHAPSENGLPLRSRTRNPYVFAWIFTTFYAASDEFHQSFVSSRGASVHDVVIDATGAAIALLAVWQLRKFLRGHATRRKPSITPV